MTELRREAWERDGIRVASPTKNRESVSAAPQLGFGKGTGNVGSLVAGVYTEGQVLALQRAAGNRAVARMLSRTARGASPGRRARPAGARGLVQRVLERFPGTEKGGKAYVKGQGLKDLLRETDDGKLYFKSEARSKQTEWVLVEVKPSADGKNYEKTGAERTAKAPAPQTRADWKAAGAYISSTGDKMLWPTDKYPHVTIDLKTEVKEPTDRVEFETMHFSRSKDDPFRSGYKITAGGWQPVKPNDKKDKQKECDDFVDKFLESVGRPERVIRK